MKKLFTVLVLSVLLFSCSAEEESLQTTHSFTVPDPFIGSWVVELPEERRGEPVQINKHDLNINGLIVNTGIDGATNQITYYNIHGDLHPDGVQVIYGTHDVLFQYFTTNGLWLVTVDVETREEVQLYLVR